MRLLAFDCDGVLRDEKPSYERCIIETVAHFSGGNRPTGSELTDSMKESNDDWERTHKILRARGRAVPFDDVRNHFQDLYLGKKRDFTGYINLEQWLAYNGLLGVLAGKDTLAIVSGAPREEIEYALGRNDAMRYFRLILGMHDCKGKRDGLEKAIAQFNPDEVFFVDDRPSSIQEAKQVPEIKVFGILPPLAAAGWGQVLIDAGAEVVFRNVKEYCKFLIEKR